MNEKHEHAPKAPKPANDSAGPRKRFRIEKLEERIAPSKGGNTTKLITDHCGSRSE